MDALDGAPGVHSALRGRAVRRRGEQRQLLAKLADVPDGSARVASCARSCSSTKTVPRRWRRHDRGRIGREGAAITVSDTTRYSFPTCSKTAVPWPRLCRGEERRVPSRQRPAQLRAKLAQGER
ncbi:MAG: hypothetical protein ACLSVD_02010 [Eggerthellaceae bacterium]